MDFIASFLSRQYLDMADAAAEKAVTCRWAGPAGVARCEARSDLYWDLAAQCWIAAGVS